MSKEDFAGVVDERLIQGEHPTRKIDSRIQLCDSIVAVRQGVADFSTASTRSRRSPQRVVRLTIEQDCRPNSNIAWTGCLGTGNAPE
jgi:hypothetical protein